MIRFLIKGLMRDRSRSLFPVLMVAAGTFLTVFLYCFMEGYLNDFVKVNAQFDTGHVKVVTPAYLELIDQVPNDLALLGVEELTATLKQEHPELSWTPRIRFNGLLDIPDENGETRSQGPVIGLAIDIRGEGTPESWILNLDEAVVRGRLPVLENEIIISEELAQKLGVRVGHDEATLLSSTMHGSMAMHNFKVVGTVLFGMGVLDRGSIITDIRDVQFALDMDDGASEIVGYTPDMIYAEQEMMTLARRFNGKHADPDDEFSPLALSMSEQGGLGDYMNLGKMVGGIIVFIFVGAMGVVLWNAGLLNGIRRYREIGIRLAMGEPKGTLYRRMIMEALVIGLIGSLIGTSLGVALCLYLQYHGIDFSSMMQKSTMLLRAEIRARVTPASYVIGFLPGLLASVVGTMFAGIGIYRRQTSQLFKELEV